ncbi:hypothetical protein [Streptomyces klenkii]|uniref:hypothetical protein n=1 Tax=Streptomyces klenkii TaxID=1420899 RepID=UPI0034242F4D
MVRITRFYLEVQDRDLGSYGRFSAEFRKAAERAAEKERNRALASTFISRATYNRWMTGDIVRAPHTAAATVLSYMFGMSVERLFRTVSEERADVLAPQGASVPAVPGVAFDDPIEVIAQAHDLTSSNTDPALLTMATAAIRSIIDRYEASGPRHLAGEAQVLRRTLSTLLAGQQPAGVRARLFILAAQVSGLLAYMAVNAGAPYQVADAYCKEAEYLAEAAKSPDADDDEPKGTALELQMWAAGTRSLALYYHQRYDEAHNAAEAGVALAPRNPQAIRLLINGCARALARMNDRTRAETAIGQAMDLTERQPHLPKGLTSCIDFVPYSEARTLANAITARLSLNDHGHVHALSAEIDERIERSDSDWSRALVRLDVATALLKQDSPELERAMLLGQRALRAGTTAPIRSVLQRANELYLYAAERWPGEPDVGDYAEELRRWRSHPQASTVAVNAPTAIAPQ